MDCDVVFTMYGSIAKEDGMHRKNHILHKIECHRIVLDGQYQV